ncbi:two-component sensor histidine kinase [Echinicola strongylocentroti]|uniref:histidine kinase n=1 Tax=Echinicola strongylocentroti TaxID=1795355 RepID=A0A2Z4ILD7_9BACT|nr:HAMP domain-containing sensor histidine kinase [Echinicola strongylocentroti]AWW31547.1 two-component sensor histidine kinase [Echinicola strongylocentroti]
MLKKRRLIIVFAIILMAVVLAVNFFSGSPDASKLGLQQIEEKTQTVAEEFDEDFIQLLMNNRPEKQVSFSTLNFEAKHPFYLYSEDGKLLFWSNVSMIPDFGDINTGDGFRPYQLIDNAKGTYFSRIRSISRNNQVYWMVQVYSLYDKVEIDNEYLHAGYNDEVFGNDRFILSAAPHQEYDQITGQDGAYFFSVSLRNGYTPIGHRSNTALLLFFFSLTGLVFILGGDFVIRLWKHGKRKLSFIYTVSILVSVRGMMLIFHFPQDYFEVPLFDPAYYASSLLNPSLGDLLLNVVASAIVLAMLISMLGRREVIVVFAKIRKRYYQWVFYLLAYLLSALFLFLFFRLFINISNNSQWNLNILDIPTFDYFKAISILILFFGGAGYLLFTLMSLNLVFYQARAKKVYALKLLLGISVPFLVVAAWIDLIYLIVYISHLILLVAIISFELYDNVLKLQLNTFLTFFFGCLVGAIITGAASYQDYEKREILQKNRLANQILMEKDVMAEFLLSDVMERIKGDLFIKNRIVNPSLSKDPVEQKIRKIYISNYFDQYDLNVMIFNTAGEDVLHRNNDQTLDDYRFRYMNSDYATSVRNLYFVKSGEGVEGNKFYTFVPMEKDGDFIGTIVMEFVQQRIQSTSVFPKLLLDKKYVDDIYDHNFDYALFRDSVLQYSVGVYNYRDPDVSGLLENDNLYVGGVSRDKYHHYGVVNGSSTLVISSPIYPLSYILADVSFFFIGYIACTLIFIIFYALLNGLNKVQFNYATKLQFYLNFAFFVPMLVISAIAIGLLSKSYLEDLHRQYFEKANIIRDNLFQYLEQETQGTMDKDDFLAEVYRLASTTATDINVFDPDGKLMATSQPNIFEKKVLTKYLDPQAYAEILEAQNTRVILDEQVGKLKYKTVYISLRGIKRQQVLGIISIPFFESEEELNVLIVDVFSTIINIFVAIFIVFLIVSYFVSKQLTDPFKLLTQKLKVTNLEDNEPMYWPINDEIGLLVNEYNNMLFKLEASRKVLALNEKESAWREMAKQVAHEIKNPLTPMKLTLQHLLRLQAEGRIDDPEKLKKPINNLINQVDTLSDIATSFSTFAKMPLPKNELMDFEQVVVGAVELFKNSERGKVGFYNHVNERLLVMGDDKLFGRVISNLIINGVQAVPEDRSAEITVILTKENEWTRLEVKDNGTGIPEELRDKIFIPNFSTKSEGSGLGLAIAKRGVETAGGNIWFETKDGQGTSFFLAFPVVNDAVGAPR